MDWMLIVSSVAFFALCGLCAITVNRQAERPE
jgi:hypothetical protein